MGTKGNIERERRRVRLVHDSVTSSGSLQTLHGVNKLAMHAYANIHLCLCIKAECMLVHKSRVYACAPGGACMIQADGQPTPVFFAMCTFSSGEMLHINSIEKGFMWILRRTW